MLETDLQKKCLKWIKDQSKKGKQWLAVNQHGSAFAQRGVSDILLCINGKFVAIELKVGKNQPTPLQYDFIERVKVAGGYTAVCWTLDEFQHAVQSIDNLTIGA